MTDDMPGAARRLALSLFEDVAKVAEALAANALDAKPDDIRAACASLVLVVEQARTRLRVKPFVLGTKTIADAAMEAAAAQTPRRSIDFGGGLDEETPTPDTGPAELEPRTNEETAGGSLGVEDRCAACGKVRHPYVLCEDAK